MSSAHERASAEDKQKVLGGKNKKEEKKCH